ncbi:thiol:disulfide interchange protein DsbA/DsbL [Rappaport israeli]|uniref:thiol:disulfide interchange protein DsbA/DsbL n=1 Tax=Rappaport israeli TaxID=1839807 RepID=UPI000931463A|nr:thiol:disulfide interchange protein DsbA/DsbL [Rappaport israeli]
MLRRVGLLSAVLACLLPVVAQAQLKYQEGVDYTILETSIDEAKSPKVIEFFWYGCPHCYTVSEPFDQWIESDKPESIEVEKVPAIPSDRWKPAAQLFYTAEQLGLDADKEIFDAIHKNNNNALVFNEKAMAQFLDKKFSVSSEDFTKAWNSFAVQQKLKRAEDLFAQARLTGVPVFVVNGQYQVENGGDLQRKFDLLTYLAQYKK